MKVRHIRNRIGAAALGFGVCLATFWHPLTDAHAAGPRPFFEAPFPCGQVWDASTYSNHWPDPDSIDITERNSSGGNTGKGQAVVASAAGTVVNSFTTNGGEYRVYIDHGGDWVSHNIHMEPDGTDPMTVGRKVAKGEQIGRTGNSGADAVHQHYTQLRDGEAVRIKFHGASIKTHAGNMNSYGTWGSDDAEKIISLNCNGNSFMGWYQGGVRYHLIYKPSSGFTKIVRVNASGSVTSTWSANWSKGYTHFIPFYAKFGGHPHAILYKHATGDVKFVRLKLNGQGVTTLKSGKWWKGWTHFVPFSKAGNRYFLAYDSVHGYANIDRIHSTSDGSTAVLKTSWIKGRTAIVPFTQGPNQYLFLYKGGDGKAKVTKIIGSGNNISTSAVWSGNWSTGYTNLVPVNHEGARYLFGYKAETGLARILKLNPGGQGANTVETMNWTKGWTAFSPFSKSGKGHILIYKIGTGQVKNLRLKSGGDGVQTIWSKLWSWGWT